MGSQILLSLITLVLGLFVARYVKKVLHRVAQKKQVQPKRIFYIEKVFYLLFMMITLLTLLMIWSIDFKGLLVFASSIFAVIGVALFAQWSILSNVTASLIIFFTFPARVGDRIRIIDKDDSIEGIIKEITLFQVEIQDDEKNRIFYPNNVLLQKPVKKICS